MIYFLTIEAIDESEEEIEIDEEGNPKMPTDTNKLNH